MNDNTHAPYEAALGPLVAAHIAGLDTDEDASDVVRSTPQGCDWRIRMHNVVASSNAVATLPACRPRDRADEDVDITPNAAQRFAIVASLQRAAIAAASVPHPVRSL